MRLLLVIMLVSAMSSSCKSQELIVDKAREFLIKQGELSEGEKAEIYIAELQTNKKLNKSRGYFRFVILGSHQLPYVGYYSQGKVYFLNNYELKNALSWFSGYLKNEKERTPLDKLDLLESFVKVLKQRATIVEQLSTDQEIEY